jgi:hypothetical protein
VPSSAIVKVDFAMPPDGIDVVFVRAVNIKESPACLAGQDIIGDRCPSTRATPINLPAIATYIQLVIYVPYRVDITVTASHAEAGTGYSVDVRNGTDYFNGFTVLAKQPPSPITFASPAANRQRLAVEIEILRKPPPLTLDVVTEPAERLFATKHIWECDHPEHVSARRESIQECDRHLLRGHV